MASFEGIDFLKLKSRPKKRNFMSTLTHIHVSQVAKLARAKPGAETPPPGDWIPGVP